MQELKVIGVESGALVAASDDGDRFRIAIDDVLQSRLRQRIPESGASRKISPREIQAHIRSGMSAEDVASVTGASIEYIQRFEGPILAEREYIVTSALSVPVHIASDLDPLEGGSGFGAVIRERLASLNSTGERWSSWKEEDGDWIIKLSFTVDNIDHDGRWSFDPKKQLLLPLNVEATTLSQHGEAPTALIPRLRAVGHETSAVDESRFDSGAFTFSRDQLTDPGAAPGAAEHPSTGHSGGQADNQFSGQRSAHPTAQLGGQHTSDASGSGRNIVDAQRPTGSDAASRAAINRATEKPAEGTSQTADLLDALRRRRGEREAGSFDDVEPEQTRSFHPGPPRLVDLPLDTFDEPQPEEPQPGKPQPDESQHRDPQRNEPSRHEPRRNDPAPARSPQQQRPSKKGRASMPSWDEIVFGARSDDDPA